MIIYKLTTDEDDEIVACYSCQEDVPTAEFDDRRNMNSKEKVRFCEVCASTRAGTAYHYPSQMGPADVIMMVAACTNRILQAIEKKNGI